MKIALLSDIHGNVDALRAVLDELTRLGVERVFCCGDLVGYYYHPAECIELLNEWNMECVRGNHEDMLFQIMGDPEVRIRVRKKYGSALERAAATLSEHHLDYLAALPRTKLVTIEGKKILLCHGAPWDTDQYIYPDASLDLFEKCAQSGADWVVCGHTHYQLDRQVDACRVINPGSVGQPRGKHRGNAHWALLDIERSVCELMETEYDASAVIRQAQRYDPEVEYLTTILTK